MWGRQSDSSSADRARKLVAMSENLREPITLAARILAGSQAICVSTGAGMSKESGLDTFRGEDGEWSKVNVEEMATPEGFERNPTKLWQWYRQRRRNLNEIGPHAGHRILAEWEPQFTEFTVVTQNIDGLHHRAGSHRVIELHGRLDVARCTHCDYSLQTLDDLGADPTCPKCQRRLRPGVVWFGEPLPPGAIETAFMAAQRCDTLLVIGTSGVVQPAASLVTVAQAYGARIIEINPNPSEFSSSANVCIRDGCRDALVALNQAWTELKT